MTIDPLRDIIVRVFGTEYEQRLKDMDTICGQELRLKAHLKDLQEQADKSSKKTAPAKRLPRAKLPGGSRRSGKRQPKARVAAKRAASPEPNEEPETDGEGERGGDETSDEEMEEVTSVAEDVGWLRAMLVAEAALLPKHEQEAMHDLIPHLHARPLFDKVIRATKAPVFSPTAWLLQPNREADLIDWTAAAARVAAAEMAGARVLGFEIVLQRPGEAARVLFACFGEVACSSDSLGRHATLSYVDSDRAVLPASTPSNVSAAIFRASMLAMVVKLFRCGATWLWLSACSPDWWWCKATRKIYADHFLVATSGRTHGKDVPRSLKRDGVEAMMADAKAERDAKLRDTVYPMLLERGRLFGIMAPGAGKWLATPGAGSMTPLFVDDVFSKRLLEPSEADHPRAPAGSYQPSFLDAELAASNKAAQIFTAQLKSPDSLASHASRFAEVFEQTAAKASKDEAEFCIWRAKQFEAYTGIAMALSRVPSEYQTLGQLARHKVREAYLAMQTNARST